MDISKINSMCNSISDEKNQIIGNITHNCGECGNFDTVAGGICIKYQTDVSSLDECKICEGKDFRQIFFE